MALSVGILGATGMVGQRFIQCLEGHPWFKIKALLASERSAGKKYKEAAKWYLPEEIPPQVEDMVVEEIDPGAVEKFSLDLVFSAIPSSIAREVEGSFAEKVAVFSNTSTYRMEDDVPLMVPELNPEHLDLLKIQKEKRGWNGFIVTNPNCSVIGLVIPLKAIYDSIGIKTVNVATMQALSGAGYAGVPSMGILDNMIPFIGGEEEKVEQEPLKILGELRDGKIKQADFPIFASCNRIMVRDGHTEAVFIETEKDFKEEGVKEIFRKFSRKNKLDLPTAPNDLIVVLEEEDRPQPLFDRDRDKGMAISVGRIRKINSWLKFTCLSHNTIRGAAGASVLNAELAYKKGLLQ